MKDFGIKLNGGLENNSKPIFWLLRVVVLLSHMLLITERRK
jgi:hypothetical protein